MTPHEFAEQAVPVMAELWPQMPGGKEVQNAWATKLKPYHITKVIQAIRDHYMNAKFAPKPVDIATICNRWERDAMERDGFRQEPKTSEEELKQISRLHLRQVMTATHGLADEAVAEHLRRIVALNPKLAVITLAKPLRQSMRAMVFVADRVEHGDGMGPKDDFGFVYEWSDDDRPRRMLKRMEWIAPEQLQAADDLIANAKPVAIGAMPDA